MKRIMKKTKTRTVWEQIRTINNKKIKNYSKSKYVLENVVRNISMWYNQKRDIRQAPFVFLRYIKFIFNFSLKVNLFEYYIVYI